MLTFGYSLTQRPGQLLSWVCAHSRIKCNSTLGANPMRRNPCCPGNTIHLREDGCVIVSITHHKNSRRQRQGLGQTVHSATDPLGMMLAAHLRSGRRILARGAVLPPGYNHNIKFCWLNQDGLPLTLVQWRHHFAARLQAATGSSMAPLAARHLTVGVICDGFPGAPTREQAADVMGHSMAQQQKSYWLSRQQVSTEAAQAGMAAFRKQVQGKTAVTPTTLATPAHAHSAPGTTEVDKVVVDLIEILSTDSDDEFRDWVPVRHMQSQKV